MIKTYATVCLTVMGILMNSCGMEPEPKTLIIAHRGASYLAPENTLASVVKAWELDTDAVEVDIHASLDGRLMVIHDGTTNRTTGVDRVVAETESSELRTLDAGSWKSPEFAGEKIPFLEEVIGTIPQRKLLFVEIKCGQEALPTLKRIIDESGKKSDIVIIGFGFDTVTECKKLMPDVPTYWLTGTKKDETTGEFIPHDSSLIEQTKSGGLDGLDVHYAGIDAAFALEVKAAGIGLYTWTVNDPAEFKRLRALGIDGVTTDRPGWMGEEIKQRYK